MIASTQRRCNPWHKSGQSAQKRTTKLRWPGSPNSWMHCHIVVVTAESLPSRIASIALGTGDLDCVYHFALPELEAAVDKLGNDDSKGLLMMMTKD